MVRAESWPDGGSRSGRGRRATGTTTPDFGVGALEEPFGVLGVRLAIAAFGAADLFDFFALEFDAGGFEEVGELGVLLFPARDRGGAHLGEQTSARIADTAIEN